MREASPRRRDLLKALRTRDRNAALEALDEARREHRETRRETSDLTEALAALESGLRKRREGSLVSAADLEADVLFREKIAVRKLALEEELAAARGREVRAKKVLKDAQETLTRAIKALEAVCS